MPRNVVDNIPKPVSREPGGHRCQESCQQEFGCCGGAAATREDGPEGPERESGALVCLKEPPAFEGSAPTCQQSPQGSLFCDPPPTDDCARGGFGRVDSDGCEAQNFGTPEDPSVRSSESQVACVCRGLPKLPGALHNEGASSLDQLQIGPHVARRVALVDAEHLQLRRRADLPLETGKSRAWRPSTRSLAALAVGTWTVLGEPATCPEMSSTTFQSLYVRSRDDTVSRRVASMSLAAVVAPLQPERMVPKARKGTWRTCLPRGTASLRGRRTNRPNVALGSLFCDPPPRDGRERHARRIWPNPEATMRPTAAAPLLPPPRPCAPRQRDRMPCPGSPRNRLRRARYPTFAPAPCESGKEHAMERP